MDRDHTRKADLDLVPDQKFRSGVMPLFTLARSGVSVSYGHILPLLI